MGRDALFLVAMSGTFVVRMKHAVKRPKARAPKPRTRKIVR